MALNKNEVIDFNNKKERIVNACLKILATKNLNIPRYTESKQAAAEILNGYFQQSGGDIKSKNEQIKELCNCAEGMILAESEFDWIKFDERACYWVWGTLRKGTINTSHSGIQKFWDRQQAPSPYESLSINTQPTSSSERLDLIIEYFDRCNQPISIQNEMLNSLKQDWSQIFGEKNPFKWLKSDDESSVRWALNYLDSYGKKRASNDRPTLIHRTVIDTKERYLAFFAAFDTWKTHEAAKILFIQDIKRAWQQKKHRDQREGRKACNFVLSEEAIAKLDLMVKEQNISKNELIQNLILMHYDDEKNVS